MWIPALVDSVTVSVILEQTAAVGIAGAAHHPVLAHQKLEDRPAYTPEGGVLGGYHHPFLGGAGTRGLQPPLSLDFNHTEPATAGWCYPRVVAEMGDIHPVFVSRFQDSVAFFGFAFDTVYLNVYKAHLLPL
jgi:hypothetical protein